MKREVKRETTILCIKGGRRQDRRQQVGREGSKS